MHGNRIWCMQSHAHAETHTLINMGWINSVCMCLKIMNKQSSSSIEIEIQASFVISPWWFRIYKNKQTKNVKEISVDHAGTLHLALFCDFWLIYRGTSLTVSCLNGALWTVACFAHVHALNQASTQRSLEYLRFFLF